MKLRQLEFFVRSVETGSFTAAARALHVSQPTLGQQIQELEEELGAKLFERGARGVEPTAAGRIFGAHAQDILSRVGAAKAAVRALRVEAKQEIKLGAPPTPARLLVPELMVRLHASLGIRAVPHAGLSDDLVALIGDGRIDAALCYDTGVPHGLDEAPLLDETMFLVGLPSLVDARAGDIPFRELSAFPLVLDSRFRGARQRIEDAARQRHVRLDVTFDVEAIELRRELMRLHGRCTIVPIGAYFDAIASGELAARRIVDPGISRTLGLVTRRGFDAELRVRILEMTRAIVAEKVADGRYFWRAA